MAKEEFISEKKLNIEGIVFAIKEMDEKKLPGFVLIGYETEDRQLKKYRVDMQKLNPVTLIGMLEEFKAQFFANAHKKE